MNNDEHMLFQPAMHTSEMPENQIQKHFEKHYKKHLFGLGIILGMGIFKIASMFLTSLNINLEADILSANYEPTAIETALKIIDQIDVIANQKDKFFHQEGKIYSLTGEALFHKSDITFHMLDSTYHSAPNTEEKWKRGKKLIDFLNAQDTLFHSTEDINTDRDMSFHTLEKTLQQLEKQIQNE